MVVTEGHWPRTAKARRSTPHRILERLWSVALCFPQVPMVVIKKGGWEHAQLCLGTVLPFTVSHGI